MNGHSLAADIKALAGQATLEVYLRQADNTHVMVEGVRVVRYNDGGPLIIEIVTDESLVPANQIPDNS